MPVVHGARNAFHLKEFALVTYIVVILILIALLGFCVLQLKE